MRRSGAKRPKTGASEEEPAQTGQRRCAIEGLEEFKRLQGAWPEDMDAIFTANEEIMPQVRRQELWVMMVEDAADVCDRFAWATPDERALRILCHFAPLVEIGAGAGYWAHCVQQRRGSIVPFDKYAPHTTAGTPRQAFVPVNTGGPEVLARRKYQHHTLFLCYPDDFEDSDASMAAACLAHFRGASVIHAGELFGDTPMLDKAPWGRTSGRAFQRLFSEYRCILKVPLPSWPHCNDSLTVWRRLSFCSFSIRGPSAMSSDTRSTEAAQLCDVSRNALAQPSAAGAHTRSRDAAAAAGATTRSCAAAASHCERSPSSVRTSARGKRAGEAASLSRPQSGQSSAAGQRDLRRRRRACVSAAESAATAARNGRSKQDIGSEGPISEHEEEMAGRRGTKGSEDSESEIEDDDGEIEFACDFRDFVMQTSAAPSAAGQAVPPLLHLLAAE